MALCENCNKEHDATYGSGRFCSNKCARSFSTKSKRDEINKKVSNKLTGNKLTKEHRANISKGALGRTVSDETRKKISDAKKGIPLSDEEKAKISRNMRTARGKRLNSILDLSPRTVVKIFDRMNMGCSRCGWNEASCDLHHINGRKIPNADNHDNLCLLCPNCHRLCHSGKIKKEELISLTDYMGDIWRLYYNI